MNLVPHGALRWLVEGRPDAEAVLNRHVRVNHGRLRVLVAQQFLRRADVAAILQEVRGKAVPQAMDGRGFGDAGLGNRS